MNAFKSKKKFLTILLTLSFCLSSIISAYAATDDGDFSATSNRKVYTPRSCSIQLTATNVYFHNLRWDDVTFGSAYYWEGELRGASTNISKAYSGVSSVVGSLPQLYKEYDEDDASIGCKDMSAISSSKTYYAGLGVSKGSKFDSGVDILFESEYGLWGGIDGLPLNYQRFYITLNTKTNKNTAWGVI